MTTRPASWHFPNPATPLGSSTYYSLRFSPPGLRDDLAILAAWRHQVHTILVEVSDPGVARLKLQWWREELDKLPAGQPSHPLSQAVQAVVSQHQLPLQPFLQMAGQVEEEILRRPLPDSAALIRACDADLGALFELMAGCQGFTDPDRIASVRAIGAFCALVYRIRDSGWLARQGRAPIPMDLLGPHNLAPDALRQGPQRARLPEWLPELARQAQALQARSSHLGALPPFARVRARILASLLREIEVLSYQVVDQRLSLTPLRKLWIAWHETWR
ncbi:MAG: squalene/phytoene synthase family protein [Chromatiaceae bacterium]|nr:squalene/phytoene synthase family protein [Chromatiaceae bacterium]